MLSRTKRRFGEPRSRLRKSTQMNENDQKVGGIELPSARSFQIEFTIGPGKPPDQEFELDGMKFKVECAPQRKSNESYFKTQISIFCNEKSLNNLWKCSASFEVSGDIVEKMPKTAKCVFDCYNKKLLIDELLCNELAPIVLKTKLEEVVGTQPIPHFDFEIPGFSDVTFLIGEKSVYAHKSILATNSTYFSAMFLSCFVEKAMAEIRLEDVNSDEFIELLNALYPTNHEVTENNVECLLRVADMYHVERVLKKCEKFLETTTKIQASKKLHYAERYLLENLEKICMDNLKSVTDIRILLNELPAKNKEEKLNCLSETMQTKILERFSKFHVSDFCFLERSSEVETPEDKNNNNTIEQKFEEWKDTVLLIEGVELLVNRAYLSIFSSYFQELFYEDIRKDSFELEDVNCDDFLEFLSYVQDPDKIIIETVIDNITSLSERFGVSYMLNRCKKYWEDVIQQNDTKPLDINVMLLLFDASEKFQFSNIQERVLSRIKAKNEMRAVMISPEFNKLGPKSRLAILRCFFTPNSADF